MQTWSGRYRTAKDTFVLELRTIDLSSGGSYPLLSTVTGLPSDSLYLVACPPGVGGVVVVTSTGIVHVEQSGKVTGTAVNAWWEYSTAIKADKSGEDRRLSLDGSKCVFVTERDMLLVLQNGDVHQVRFEMDGRSVGAIKVDEQSSEVPPPSSVVIAGDKALFIGSAEGDSLLAKVEALQDMITLEVSKPQEDIEMDWDEDLYGDINAPTANGGANGSSRQVPSGPVKIRLTPYDVLTGVGKILEMEFGVAMTDQGVSLGCQKHVSVDDLAIQVQTYPQLLAVGGGSKRSTFNVFRRGIPITKRRRFNELVNADAVWFLPIQRQSGQRFKGIPESERTTLLLSMEAGQTRIFALSTRATPEQIGRIGSVTVSAAPFFGRSTVVHVSIYEVSLLDHNGKVQQVILPADDDNAPIVSASISDPYIAIRRADGQVSLFIGDSVARTVTEAHFPGDQVSPHSLLLPLRDLVDVC